MTNETTIQATETISPATQRSPEAAPPEAEPKPKNGGNRYPFPTKREILARLETDPGYRITALLTIHARQTDDERADKETRWKNRRGFMSSHAVNGSKLAEKVLSGEGLTPEDEEKVAGIVCRYGKQLAAHAREEALADRPELADQAACFFGG